MGLEKKNNKIKYRFEAANIQFWRRMHIQPGWPEKNK